MPPRGWKETAHLWVSVAKRPRRSRPQAPGPSPPSLGDFASQSNAPDQFLGDSPLPSSQYRTCEVVQADGYSVEERDINNRFAPLASLADTSLATGQDLVGSQANGDLSQVDSQTIYPRRPYLASSPPPALDYSQEWDDIDAEYEFQESQHTRSFQGCLTAEASATHEASK